MNTTKKTTKSHSKSVRLGKKSNADQERGLFPDASSSAAIATAQDSNQTADGAQAKDELPPVTEASESGSSDSSSDPSSRANPVEAEHQKPNKAPASKQGQDSSLTADGTQVNHELPPITEASESGSSDSSDPSSCTDTAETEQQERDKTLASKLNDSSPVDAYSQTWLLATNHQNMAYTLSAAMLMGPAGFGGKHYDDPAGKCPGWLPLFRNSVPEGALKDSISERKDLRPCIGEVGIKGLCGPVRLIRRDGEIGSMSLPGTIDGDVVALLVPAPLPTTLLTRIHFSSEGDRKQFEAVLRSDPTVNLSQIQVEVSGQLFTGAAQMTWPPHNIQTAEASATDDQSPAQGQAIGGVLAMLYHLANRSNLCCSAFRVVAGDSTQDDKEAIKRDPILRELPNWLENAEFSAAAPPPARLYWGVARALVDARLNNSTSAPIDTVLEYLNSQLDTAQPSELRQRLQKLINAMKDTFGMARGTNSDLFMRYQGSLSRPLLLLCLRERCMDLLEFSLPDLNEEELVLAAILFGIREGGWRKLPSELRRPEALANFAIDRMIAIEQRQTGQSLTLRSQPPRPKPLRELIPADERAWSAAFEKAVVSFVRKREWEDCIVTRIAFAGCSHDLKNSSGKVEIIVHGIIDQLTHRFNKDGLLKRFSQWPPLPAEIEDELRGVLLSEETSSCG
jgi:hypothetical protein